MRSELPKGWKRVKLGEVVSIKHGFAFKGEFIVDYPTRNIILTPGNFKIGGGFKSDRLRYYDNGGYPSEYILNNGDLVVTMTDLSKTGDTLGYSAILPTNQNTYLHNQRIGLVNIVSSNVYDHFIYWLMRTQPYQLFIVNTATGSTVKHTSPSRIYEYEFSLPPYHTQKSIADILSSLDDKIENNNKINAKLEEIAQTLFKHWFIDFEFPDENGNPYKSSGGEMVDSELGMIPRNYAVGKLSDIADVTMGQSPDGNSYNETGEGEVFYQGRAEFGWRFPTRRLFTTEPKRMAQSSDVLMSVRAPVGDVNIAMENCCIGRGLAALHAKRNAQSYLYYLLKNLRQELDMFNSEGTVFGSINRSDLNNLMITIPTIEMVKQFQDIVSLIDLCIKNNVHESINLSTLRDTLLPKLMSGDIL